MSDVYVGLMSGTSMDGIDAVAVSFDARSVHIHAHHSEPYSADLRSELLAAASKPLDVDPDPAGRLHRAVGDRFCTAANAVIDKSAIGRDRIVAIGSHGQTLRHQPNATPPYSLQIGDAGIIAAGTGCTTIADFRSADIEAGGQGAPLVPPFHEWLFNNPNATNVIVNIGGIANITVLHADGADTIGFDTGPGNGLMDAWIRASHDKPYDEDGGWAASGEVSNTLLLALLKDPYFQLPAPKSTGFEYFNMDWLSNVGIGSLNAANVQATLTELTATTIAQQVEVYPADAVYVCGGGAHNSELMRRLRKNLNTTKFATTAQVGLDPDWVEAVAFAWLAKRYIAGETGNLPSVTGATHKVVLGEIHSPRQ